MENNFIFKIFLIRFEMKNTLSWENILDILLITMAVSKLYTIWVWILYER